MVPTSSNSFHNTALFLICSMSPTAKTGIETESYRQSVDTDEADSQHILESAFLNLIKDLQATGLVLDVDYSEVFEDQDTLLTFLNLAAHLLPNTLYATLKDNARITDCLGHILDGSLGDDETLIQTYLSELGGLDGQEALVPELAEIVDRYYGSLSQTSIFTDYMRNIYHLIRSERFAPEFDAEAHEAYRKRIRTLIVRFAEVLEAFADNVHYKDLCRIQDQMILDIVAPINFAAYNYIFTIDQGGLPDDLVQSFDRQWYHYQVSHNWCPQYYVVRNEKPSKAQIMAMYCFLYAVHEDQADYQKEVEVLYHLYPETTVKHTIDGLYREQR